MRTAPALTRFPVIKLCGLRDQRDVDAAVSAGATAVGFVLTPSPRQISLEDAASLTTYASTSVDTVLVLDARRWSGSAADLAGIGARAVQMHHPTLGLAAELRALGVPLILARQAEDSPPSWAAGELALLDSHTSGSGQAWDWNKFAPAGEAGPWILAGGLTPDTVVVGIRRTRPWGVDVSSGIEDSPGGRKSPELMRRFVEQAGALEPSAWGGF